MSAADGTTARGIGASVLRREDARHLDGRGEFVPDIRLPDIRDVAFLRSPHAHARIKSIRVPPGMKGRIFTAADLPRIQPIRVVTQAAGAKSPPWPPLATDKVRYVGEAIAVCVAPTRGEAEDLAGQIEVEYDVLDAAVDAPQVWRGSRHLVHESWGDNLYLERVIEGGDIEAAARAAELTVTLEYRMHRQSGAPMEGRAVLAYRDHRLDEVVVYASTQTPHTVRVALGEILGIEQRRIRVVAPDVGGGFGPKARLYPEEVILAALALELDHPVRWIEDRSEKLLTCAHTRDHHYKVTASAAGMRYDTGDYPASVKLCAELLDMPRVRARQKRGEADGRLIGIGFASFTEQTAHGAAEFASRGASIIPGFESCTARILPDGSLVLHVGVQSHGQGLETTLSQIACQELGIDPSHISVRHGDTESTAFGFGTFASRSMVMSGGAVARASRMLRDKLCRIGAHLLQCDPAQVRCTEGAVLGPQGSVPIAEIAHVAHLRMDGLPPGVDPLLDATATYEPAIGTGVFCYATHGALVAVDPETGFIDLLDFAVAEDCGTMVNPMIVEGQIRGGVVQGIGTALYEEIPYDETGQPLAGTLADYLLPGAAEMPAIKIAHLHTPAAATEYGMKGMGEGGAVAPPAAH